MSRGCINRQGGSVPMPVKAGLQSISNVARLSGVHVAFAVLCTG